jgi:hypothetical protein
MTRTTITANWIQTIAWFNNTIIDWANAGQQYTIDGKGQQLYMDSFGALDFDGAICSADGQYAFIYQKLGTKGLLLKENTLLREINRSYYYANVYEYPAAFVTINNVTYLIHCPKKYCRLDFENVETGEIVTDIPGRDPFDFFHSRLEINLDSTLLTSKGWHWHPFDKIKAYKIKDCIENPLLLDNSALYPELGTEICTASFISRTKVLIGSSDEVFDDEEEDNFPIKHIAIWDIETDEISKPVKVNGDFGNLFAINEELAWDTYLYPKIININTGEVVAKDESVNSGKQKSSIVSKDDLVQLVFNRATKQLAVVGNEVIEVFTP